MLIETTNKADLRLTSLLPNLANTSVISAKLKKKKKNHVSAPPDVREFQQMDTTGSLERPKETFNVP